MNWLTTRFELGRGGQSDNLRSMEGLRGFAVFLVFIVHYVTLVQPWLSDGAAVAELASAFRIIGNSGVDLFFVLSGYLIYGTLIGRKSAYGRFMARRIQRIYPTFILVFLIYVALSLAVPRESKLPADRLDAAIYLLQNLLLLPGLFPIEPLITVAWSLSYEMFYYLAIPLVISTFGLRSASPRSRVIFFSIFFVSFILYCSLFGGHVRLIMFVSGILAFEAIHSGPQTRSFGDALGALALVAGLAGMLIPLDGRTGGVFRATLLAVTFPLLCVCCFRPSRGWLARIFAWAPMRWLGNMSYSYYLIHGLALKVAFAALAYGLAGVKFGTWAFFGLLPVMFAITLVVAAVLFLFVERPYSLDPARSAPKQVAVGLGR